MPAGTTDILVRFLADTSKLRAETAQVEGTGGKLKTWAAGVGAAIGAAFVVTKVKDFVSAAAELQDQIGASEQIFGDAAGAVQRYAETTADAFGISKTAALEGANTFAAFGKSAGLTGTDLSTFSTDLVSLAGDLSSFRGTTTEEAITAVGAALRNEAEPIRAYGVLLDEGTLKARALAMGLVSATGDADKIASAQIAAASAQKTYNKTVEEYGEASPEAQIAAQKLELAQSKLGEATAGTVPELTGQQKVLAAQAELFAQTGDAQGDAARNSDNAALQQKRLTAQMEEAGAAIGTALLPVIQKLLPYISKLATFFEQNAGILVPVAAGLIALAVAFKIATVASALFTTVGLGPMLLIVLAVMAGIAALIAIGYLIVRNWDTIKAAAFAVWNAIQVAWDAILRAIQAVWQWIQSTWATVYEFLSAPIVEAVAAIVGVWDAIVVAIKAVIDWIATNWPLLLAILTGPIGLAVLAITQNWNTIKDAVTALWGWIRDKWNAIVDVIRSAASTISGIIGGITSAFDRVKNAATEVWQWVGDKFRALADIIGGVVDGIRGSIGRVVSAIKAPINAIIRAWNGISFRVPQFSIPEVDTHIPGIGKIGGGSFGGQSFDFPNIPELARGGIVTAPTLALIGERGAEAVVPLGRGGVGGRTYVLNVTVSPGTDPARTGRAIVELIQSFERANGTDWRRAVV